jgi:hypothetical protein
MDEYKILFTWLTKCKMKSKYTFKELLFVFYLGYDNKYNSVPKIVIVIFNSYIINLINTQEMLLSANRVTFNTIIL